MIEMKLDLTEDSFYMTHGAEPRDRLKRKLKMANLLASEELLDEARDALKDAVLFAGRLIAAEARLNRRTWKRCSFHRSFFAGGITGR